MSSMVRKQVYLTAEQDRLLRRAAKQHRRTEAEIIRDALDRTLGHADEDPRSDPLWGLVAVSSGSARDASENVDEIVYGLRKK